MGVAPIKMPQLGESVTEGTVDKWLKKEGDYVRRDEPLVEVVTDKVNAEIPSPYEGRLVRISVQEGTTIPIGVEIAAIEVADGADGAPADATSEATAPTAPTASAPASSITAISTPIGMVVPSATEILTSLPSNGEGISALTLSVTTSTMGSSRLT